MIQRIMVEVLSDCTFSYFEVSDKYKFCWCYFGELKKTRYFAGFFLECMVLCNFTCVYFRKYAGEKKFQG